MPTLPLLHIFLSTTDDDNDNLLVICCKSPKVASFLKNLANQLFLAPMRLNFYWPMASQNIPNISWRSDGVAQSNTVGSYGMTYGPGVSPKAIYI
jgi:hypothetical protein